MPFVAKESFGFQSLVALGSSTSMKNEAPTVKSSQYRRLTKAKKYKDVPRNAYTRHELPNESGNDQVKFFLMKS